jgi:hypothetical protein
MIERSSPKFKASVLHMTLLKRRKTNHRWGKESLQSESPIKALHKEISKQ